MINFTSEVVFSLAFLALLLLALYWVIRTAVAACIRSALPDSALRGRGTDAGR